MLVIYPFSAPLIGKAGEIATGWHRHSFQCGARSSCTRKACHQLATSYSSKSKASSNTLALGSKGWVRFLFVFWSSRRLFSNQVRVLGARGPCCGALNENRRLFCVTVRRKLNYNIVRGKNDDTLLSEQTLKFKTCSIELFLCSQVWSKRRRSQALSI